MPLHMISYKSQSFRRGSLANKSLEQLRSRGCSNRMLSGTRKLPGLCLHGDRVCAIALLLDIPTRGFPVQIKFSEKYNDYYKTSVYNVTCNEKCSYVI